MAMKREAASNAYQEEAETLLDGFKKLRQAILTIMKYTNTNELFEFSLINFETDTLFVEDEIAEDFAEHPSVERTIKKIYDAAELLGSALADMETYKNMQNEFATWLEEQYTEQEVK